MKVNLQAQYNTSNRTIANAAKVIKHIGTKFMNVNAG